MHNTKRMNKFEKRKTKPTESEQGHIDVHTMSVPEIGQYFTTESTKSLPNDFWDKEAENPQQFILETLPSLDDINSLTPQEQTKALHLLSTTVHALVGEHHYFQKTTESSASRISSELKTYHETEHGSTVVANKVLATAIRMEQLNNHSDTTGQTLQDAQTILEFANKRFKDTASAAETALYNPYAITAGTTYYKLAKDKKHLTKHTVQDIAFDGEHTGVELQNNDILPLIELNAQLASGNAMLEDGSNYYGTKLELLVELSNRAAQDHVTLTFSTPKGAVRTEAVFVHTNITDLEAQYNNAFKSPAFIDRLVTITLTANGNDFDLTLEEFKQAVAAT